jgi:hypothetical protein
LAAELNIELVYIPPGATDKRQPLDRMVCGALKSEARRLFRWHASRNPKLNRHKQDAVRDMIEAWEGFSDATLNAVWQLYREDDDWGEGFSIGDCLLS